MSQRMGMADGRVFTISTSSGLLNDFIMEKNGIQYADNYSFRQALQKQGPALLDVVTNNQNIDVCRATVNETLLKVPNTY
jgi:hypothetical protein